jgi:phosphoribosylcarboxyaminoimidazole (NCAIR) mutase
LIFFGSNGIGLGVKVIGLAVVGAGVVAGAGAGVCAAASAGQIAAAIAAPAVSADPVCTKLRRSNSVVIVVSMPCEHAL